MVQYYLDLGQILYILYLYSPSQAFMLEQGKQFVSYQYLLTLAQLRPPALFGSFSFHLRHALFLNVFDDLGTDFLSFSSLRSVHFIVG